MLDSAPVAQGALTQRASAVPDTSPRQSHVRRLGAGNAAEPLAVCGEPGESRRHRGAAAGRAGEARAPPSLLTAALCTAAREIADKRGLPRVGWRPEVK